MAIKNTPAKVETPSSALMTGFKKDLNDIIPYLEAVLPKQYVPRFIRMAHMAVMRIPKLLQCTKTSVLMSLFFCAVKNLEPGVEDGCWILPFKDKTGNLIATPVPGYKGLITRAVQVGAAKAIKPRGIYANDYFFYEYGKEDEIKHTPPQLGQDRGALIGAWVRIILPNGEIEYEVMDRPQMEKVRNSGAAWRFNPDTGPWNDWEEAMFLKTVIKKGLKTIPMKEDLRDLLADDGAIEAGAGIAALMAAAGEENLPPELKDAAEKEALEGPGGSEGSEAAEGKKKSSEPSAFDLLVDKKLEGMAPAEVALKKERLAENIRITAKNMKKTVAQFKEMAANYFGPWTTKKDEPRAGFWADFLTWEAATYPASTEGEQEPGEQEPPKTAEGEPPSSEAEGGSPTLGTSAFGGPMPIFADRKKNLVMKILGPPIPMGDLNLLALEQITPENIEDIETKVATWKKK